MRMDCSKHKGHRYFHGGKRDGEVDHLVYDTPSDFPKTMGTVLRDGVRSWYEIDYDASEGSEVHYRCIGVCKDFPQRPIQHEEDR